MRNSSGSHNLGLSSPLIALSTTGSLTWFFDTPWRGHCITKFYASVRGSHACWIHFIERIALIILDFYNLSHLLALFARGYEQKHLFNHIKSKHASSYSTILVKIIQAVPRSKASRYSVKCSLGYSKQSKARHQDASSRHIEIIQSF